MATPAAKRRVVGAGPVARWGAVPAHPPESSQVTSMSGAFAMRFGLLAVSASAALAVTDECQSSEDASDCAFSALQRRARGTTVHGAPPFVSTAPTEHPDQLPPLPSMMEMEAESNSWLDYGFIKGHCPTASC
eukprot:Skav205537  [mRNA]  locus=scaffold1012:73379:76577:- [translate_table: standard]